MKFVSFKVNGRVSWGTVEGERIADLGARGVAASLLEHVASGADTPSVNDADHRLAEVALMAPIDARRIFCIGLNYRAHAAEAGREVGEFPTIFTRTGQSLVPHGRPMLLPLASSNYDFEGELALVIGRPGRHIRKEHALDHVFGYSVFNDGSVRDFQATSITAGKNFDNSGAFGPWIVDRREAPEWDKMTLITRLNSTEVQKANTDTMIFGVPEIIEYLSKIATLLPGDVVATGTPAGVGLGRKPPLWMKAGDRIEVEISGIGLLSNPIESEQG